MILGEPVTYYLEEEKVSSKDGDSNKRKRKAEPEKKEDL